MKQTSTRSGILLNQPSGYQAFSPTPLIPLPQLKWDEELATLLSEAALGIGRLDGLSRILPNQDLFVSIFIRQEAVLSSQIEGTQCTLEDILNFPVQPDKANEDVHIVINYVEAINYGLARLKEVNGLPLSIRLLREIHTVLMNGARGQNRAPGEVRRTQNWIGPAGSTIMTASYVPPPVPEMHEALSDLEKFLHIRTGISPLIQIALAHAQFETIHPFLDGNGRLGRLLITLFLCERNLLKTPLLYLSHYLKINQFEYYKRLTAVREDGDWENWLKFFLSGIKIVSDQAVNNAELLLALTTEHRSKLAEAIGSVQAMRLLDYLCEQPIVTVQMVADKLACAYVTALRLINEFEKLELLKETTTQKRNKRFEYAPYLRFWKEIQDDYASIELQSSEVQPNNIQPDYSKLTQAIAALQLPDTKLQLSAGVNWQGHKVIVNGVEICTITEEQYKELMEPLKAYPGASPDSRKLMTAKLLSDTAHLLQKLIKTKNNPIDEYQLLIMNKELKVSVHRENQEITFRFIEGDFAELLKEANEIRIPWQYKLVSGTKSIKETGTVTEFGFDQDGPWLKLILENGNPDTSRHST